MGEMDVIEQKMLSFEKFVEKQEENNKRMWERIDKQSQEMVRLQVLMENVGKTLDEVKVALTSFGKDQTIQSSKWEQFYSKSFWVLVGAGFSYFIYKASGH